MYNEQINEMNDHHREHLHAFMQLLFQLIQICIAFGTNYCKNRYVNKFIRTHTHTFTYVQCKRMILKNLQHLKAFFPRPV